ncbi:hypothetical protein DRJ48_05365, partial [Candidatus Woesearchaeota archaeon]
MFQDGFEVMEMNNTSKPWGYKIRGLFVLFYIAVLAVALSNLVGAETSIVLHPDNSYIDVYGIFNMSNHRIVNLATPSADADAATKAYVDSLVSSQGGSASGWNDTGTVVELLTSSDNVDANTLYVDNSLGRVGIGTSSPTQTLHVSGTVNITS